MGLQDVTGVFSRYFIVGFFLPSFFGLFALVLFASTHLYPHGFQPRTQTGILALGGSALLLGLLLLGLNYPLTRVFEGYPIESLRPLRLIHGWLLALQKRAYCRLSTEGATATAADATDVQRYRGAVALRKLDWAFPFGEGRLLPTRFGNAIRASEDYAYSRWRLDVQAIWPRVEPLLSDQERELHTNAKCDMAFFMNAGLIAPIVGAILVADELAHSPLAPIYAWLYVLPFAIGYALYRFAVGAAQRWGAEVRASVDLHRLEVYERLGVVRPKGFRDECERVAPALNRFLLYAEDIPDDLWLDPTTAGTTDP
jgi:hypothetical protein